MVELWDLPSLLRDTSYQLLPNHQQLPAVFHARKHGGNYGVGLILGLKPHAIAGSRIGSQIFSPPPEPYICLEAYQSRASTALRALNMSKNAEKLPMATTNVHGGFTYEVDGQFRIDDALKSVGVYDLSDNLLPYAFAVMLSDERDKVTAQMQEERGRPGVEKLRHPPSTTHPTRTGHSKTSINYPILPWFDVSHPPLQAVGFQYLFA